MAKVRLIGQRAMNRVISHQEGVKAAVYAEAKAIAGKASMRLERAKNRTGDAQVIVKRGDVDSYVILDDPAALSIEFGHWYVNGNGDPKYVPGLYIITGAAGLV